MNDERNKGEAKCSNGNIDGKLNWIDCAYPLIHATNI